MSLYDNLGVKENATWQEIKNAYKSKSQKLHPDKNPNPNALQEFREVQKAYSVLKDPDRRKYYDKTGNEKGTEHGEACKVIADIYLQVAKQNGYQPKDYLQDIKITLRNSIKKTVNEGILIKREINAIKYLIDQTKGDELILRALQIEKLQGDQKLKNIEQTKVIMNRALKIIEKAEYTGHVPQDIKMSSTSTSFNSWSDPYIA